MMTEKYRFSDVAKDLKVDIKAMMDVLEKYYPNDKRKPSANMTEDEVNFSYEYFTQKAQVSDMGKYFESAAKKREEAKAPKVEEKKAENKAPSSNQHNNFNNNKQNQNNNQNNNQKPNSSNQQQQQNKKPEFQKPINNNAKPTQKPNQKQNQKGPAQARPKTTTQTISGMGESVHKEVRHVDMSSMQVNLDKYNEKYDNLGTANLGRKANDPTKLKFMKRQQGKPVRSRKEQEAEKMRRLELEKERRQKLEITLPDELTVSELALKLKVQSAEIIKRLMQQGIFANATQVIDYDTAALIAMDIGAKVEHEVVVTIEERLFEAEEEKDENLSPRCPVVVVMGHVDHGKTSLLDAIRKTHVTASEAGGITQAIGAYQVEIDGRPITFLDTPGHAAFTAMRARGASVTDIAIIVVAADDGVMPQTVEAINHAKAANVQIIVAINKMDKPHANPEKVKQELTEYGIVCEDWGGDVITCPVSAKSGDGIDNLLEMILLAADTMELKANPDKMARGAVIEARLDKGRGPIASLLVQNGTLRLGDVVIAGTALGKIRTMTNSKGEKIKEAGPCVPVEVTGLSEVPTAGDQFNAVADERLAKELVDKRKFDIKEKEFKEYQKVTLDNLFSQISEGEMKDLPIIVKADVDGSVEAVKQSLEKLSNEEVRVKVIHGAVGAISESDVMLANASNAIIIGFNVRPEQSAKDSAARDNVEIRLYRVIYDAINDLTDALKGMLTPKVREVDLGSAEVRQVIHVSSVGTVAGCYVKSGKITRTALIRIVRDGIIIADDKMSSLRRFKDDVKEVVEGFECGITLEKFVDVKEGDVFEAYEKQEYRE